MPIIAVSVLLATIGVQADLASLWPDRPCWLRSEQRLTGPYNIVVADPAVDRSGADEISREETDRLARDLRDTLDRQILDTAAADDALVRVGRSCRPRVTTFDGDRPAALDRARQAQDGDVAVSFVLRPRRYHTTVRLELSIGGSRLREAAELAGYPIFEERDIGSFEEAAAGRDLHTSAAEQTGAHLLLLRAVSQYSAADYRAALSTLTAVLEKSPGDLTRRLVLVLLGNAHGRLAVRRNFAPAQRNYEEALRLDPAYPRALLGLAEISYQEGAVDCERPQPAQLRALSQAYREYESILSRPITPDLPDADIRARAGMGRVAACHLLAGDRRWLTVGTSNLRLVVDRYERDPSRHWLRTPASEAYGMLGLLYGHVEGDGPRGAACYRRAGELAAPDQAEFFRTRAEPWLISPLVTC
ncbi:tetratricopeptide repeat protein [Paractinoplanes maris]|uniref:tetratricopeptide repeat protein n=1 Tax=Paractinoplanes maris TaxID=1734446 RepID=UPI0020212A5E|nr:hypothetical protein [Actinoplanes maris]